MSAREKAFQDEKDAKLLEWRNKMASVEGLLSERNDKFEDDDGSDVDLETVAKKRREMEVFKFSLQIQFTHKASAFLVCVHVYGLHVKEIL